MDHWKLDWRRIRYKANANWPGMVSRHGEPVQTKVLVNKMEGVLAIQGYDPVAYFTFKRAEEGDPSYTATFEDAIYQFATAAHRDQFLRYLRCPLRTQVQAPDSGVCVCVCSAEWVPRSPPLPVGLHLSHHRARVLAVGCFPLSGDQERRLNDAQPCALHAVPPMAPPAAAILEQEYGNFNVKHVGKMRFCSMPEVESLLTVVNRVPVYPLFGPLGG